MIDWQKMAADAVESGDITEPLFDEPQNDEPRYQVEATLYREDGTSNGLTDVCTMDHIALRLEDISEMSAAGFVRLKLEINLVPVKEEKK